ncbi:MAG: hypothetical protein GC184_06540 [Rhizobiales bacterium]|nr:hypothetical protein [Hyphomicrobiales bacterium]
MSRLGATIGLVAVLAAIPAMAETGIARLQGGTQVIGLNETASFPITSSTERSTEFQASCDIVNGGGTASVVFDGDHYVPLSQPGVGAVITLDPGESKHYDMTGTISANRGDAFIAFYLSGAPQAMCFPGMQCSGPEKGATSVTVTCTDGAAG